MSIAQDRMEEIIEAGIRESGAIHDYKTKEISANIWLELIQPLLYSIIKLRDNYTSLLSETGVSTNQYSLEQAQKYLEQWMFDSVDK